VFRWFASEVEYKVILGFKPLGLLTVRM